MSQPEPVAVVMPIDPLAFAPDAFPPPAPSAAVAVAPAKLEARFPYRLYEMLDYAESAGMSDVVSWLPHHRAFKIHDRDRFISHVASHFFKATKLRSIHRQLSMWGFTRVTCGDEADSWYHRYFVRGRPGDMSKMFRTKIKGSKTAQCNAQALHTRPWSFDDSPWASNEIFPLSSDSGDRPGEVTLPAIHVDPMASNFDLAPAAPVCPPDPSMHTNADPADHAESFAHLFGKEPGEVTPYTDETRARLIAPSAPSLQNYVANTGAQTPPITCQVTQVTDSSEAESQTTERSAAEVTDDFSLFIEQMIQEPVELHDPF